MKPTKFKLINTSDVSMNKLEEVAKKVTEKVSIPKFYLLCQKPEHDGLSISNTDKPIIIIDVRDIGQFEKVLKHELIHLMQYQKGYADEDFKEVVVSESNRRSASGVNEDVKA